MGQGQSQNQLTKPLTIRNTIHEEHNEVVPQTSKPVEVKSKIELPYNYESITKDAVDLPAEFPSTEKLYDHLNNGVFLNQNRKKYWIDKETGHNCFMMYARDLLITWADDKRFWGWTSVPETSDVHVDVAEILNVCWLEVHGKFDTSHLSPNTLYEVLFVVSFNILAYGWEVPVNLRLILPDGEIKEHKESLQMKPRAQWIELAVGEFITTPTKMGHAEVSMFEYEGGKWKKGLAVKGVVIRPRK